MFSEEKAKRYPPAREEDHKIWSTEDAPKFFKNHVYAMPKEQIAFLQMWIDEKLEKGFIRPSKSQYPSPTFLIKKKNNNFHVVQNLPTIEPVHHFGLPPTPPNFGLNRTIAWQTTIHQV